MSTQQTPADQITRLSYEESYEQLQEVLERMERADLALEELLELYERGTKLAAHCGQTLENAELRVKQWHPDGTLQELVVSEDE